MQICEYFIVYISCTSHTIPQSRPTMQQVSQELSTRKPPFPNALHTITLGELVKQLILEAQLSNNLTCLCSHCRPSTSSHTSPPNNMFDWQECIMFDWQKYIHRNAKLRISLIKPKRVQLFESLTSIFNALLRVFLGWYINIYIERERENNPHLK